MQAYGRDLEERWDRIMFVRDTLLTGDAYKSNVSKHNNLMDLVDCKFIFISFIRAGLGSYSR